MLEDDTYFTNQQYFHQLNELVFSEQPDVTTTPDAAPQKEGLLASAYRIVTAPFSMRTPGNVTTRHKKRKSILNKMVCINKIADNLTYKAENPSAISLRASSLNNKMNILPPNEMYLLNAQCEKCIAEEVQFYFRADVVMREESRQHEGAATWEDFQSMLIKHFYHIPSKERAAKLLNKLQQDLHESIAEYVQRGSEIIQVHSGKMNLRDISASQYGWNTVQGLSNVPIKNKIDDHIANCNSLSDVCKLIRQVRREMENREAFTGISAEPEETVEKVNWRQNNYNQRGRGYSNRGSNRGGYRGSHYQPSLATRGRGYNTYHNSNTGSNGYAKKTGTMSNPDVRCLICGLKGHKVTTCRKLPRAQELIRQDKQQYWKNKKES